MKKFALLLLPFATSCAIGGDSAWSDFHANGYGALYDLGASGSVRDLSVSQGAIDIDGDLTIRRDTDTNILMGARFGMAPMEVVLSTFDHQSSHRGSFNGDFDLGSGSSFTGSSSARTSLDFEMTKLMVGFDFLNTELFRIGLLAGVDMFKFNDFSVRASQGGVSQTYTVASDEEIPIPMIGVRGDLLLPQGFRVGAEVSGVSADVDDIDGTFLDMDVQVGWAPMDQDWVEVLIGYRAISFDFSGELDDASVDADIDFDGFYWGVGIIF